MLGYLVILQSGGRRIEVKSSTKAGRNHQQRKTSALSIALKLLNKNQINLKFRIYKVTTDGAYSLLQTHMHKGGAGTGNAVSAYGMETFQERLVRIL